MAVPVTDRLSLTDKFAPILALLATVKPPPPPTPGSNFATSDVPVIELLTLNDPLPVTCPVTFASLILIVFVTLALAIVVIPNIFAPVDVTKTTLLTPFADIPTFALGATTTLLLPFVIAVPAPIVRLLIK